MYYFSENQASTSRIPMNLRFKRGFKGKTLSNIQLNLYGHK